jgi:ABC-type dipeptide/oligopeptide/nickel transport system ATPase subunit
MRIDKLEIRNFKFFDAVEPLEFEGKNILLYGENGSGKSTIYWALYTLLQSSGKEDEKIKKYFTHSTLLNDSSLVNIHANEDDSKIELIPNEDTEELVISKNNITIKNTDLIEKSLQASDFINYKYLFRFFNFLHQDTINLFTLFEYEILHFLKDDDTDTNLYELWKEIINLVKDKPRVIKNKDEYRSLQDKLNDFNKYLKNIVESINAPANDYLKEFKYENIKLELSVTDGKYEKENFIEPKIEVIISVEKEGNPIHILRPQSYFNEAKLTAIALSVRLAITQIKLKDSSLKLLVLDDLLVSLDMSNRDIVLDILLNDDILREYQKIILTHDRAFFEMSKQKFNYMNKGKWNYFEMYLDIDDTRNIEIPYIKKYGQEYGNIEIAKEHFSNKDYPATANYLRKEVEKLFDKFLIIDNLDEKIKLAKLKENQHLILEISKNLKSLLRILKQFENCERMPQEIQAQKCQEFAQQVINSISVITEYIENALNFEEFEDVKIILKSILHPQSHNDITKPLYKKELEDSITLMEEFNMLVANNYIEE